MLVIKYIIEQPPGVTGISWAATNFHYLYPLANFYTPLYVPRLLSDALLLSLITVCFTAVAFPEEMITHFPGIASDPLPFPCTHVISKSSKRTCKWLQQFQQPKSKSQNSISSGAWEYMINESFVHWERLLQSLASKACRLYTPEP